MNYELLLALGTSAGAIVLAFLYARSAAKAATVDQLKAVTEGLAQNLAHQRALAANKEAYVRELEKTVIGSLPPGKLVDRLNIMFAAARSRPPRTLPPRK